MHSPDCQRKLVQILPLCIEKVKPGQFLKVVKANFAEGSCFLSLLPMDLDVTVVGKEMDSEALIGMEAEGWILAPLGRYLVLRLPFYLTCEDLEIDICPVRIIGGNKLACLADAEYAHVAKQGKFVGDLSDLEEYLCS